jgi:hypothetical protein
VRCQVVGICGVAWAWPSSREVDHGPTAVKAIRQFGPLPEIQSELSAIALMERVVHSLHTDCYLIARAADIIHPYEDAGPRDDAAWHADIDLV